MPRQHGPWMIRESHRVYRNPFIPEGNTNSLALRAATPGLPDAVGTTVAQGRFLNDATATQPVVVLGAGFAEYLYGDASRFVDELLALLR